MSVYCRDLVNNNSVDSRYPVIIFITSVCCTYAVWFNSRYPVIIFISSVFCKDAVCVNRVG
jgi:hypothetical protein